MSKNPHLSPYEPSLTTFSDVSCLSVEVFVVENHVAGAVDFSGTLLLARGVAAGSRRGFVVTVPKNLVAIESSLILFVVHDM